MNLGTINALIEQQNDAFEHFRKANDDKLADLTHRLDRAEAAGNRPAFGGIDNEAEKPLRKAVDLYLRKGIVSAELEAKTLQLGVSADGGYALPKVIDGLIDAIALKVSPIRRLANVVQISTSDYHKLVNVRGWGASWVTESAARPATTTATLADIAPPMGELYSNPQATQAMLDDVQFNAEGWIAEELALAFGEAESNAFVNGTGTNQPKGFLSSTTASTDDGVRAFGQVQYIPTGVAGGWAASNPQDVFLTTLSKVRQAYLDPNDCAWLVNAATFASMLTLKDTLNRSLIMPSFAAGGPPTLLGYPVVIAEHLPSIAASSYSVAFGNWKKAYMIVDRIGTRVLRDPFSNKPYVGFYATKRVGGAVVNSEAVKLIKFSVS